MGYYHFIYSLSLLCKLIITVRRVNNRSYPQQMELRPNYEHELNKLMGSRDGQNEPSVKMRKSLYDSRLVTIESYMGLAPNSEDDIFSRIKALEDRILLLESISPEYKHFVSGYLNYLFVNC